VTDPPAPAAGTPALGEARRIGALAANEVSVDDVLDAWFGDRATGRRDLPQTRRWFSGGKAFDRMLGERFGRTIDTVARGELDAWRETPEGALALIVLLDQFARNVHRGTAEAFAHGARALALAETGIARGDLERLPFVQRVFYVLPLEHDESLDSQRRALALFRRLRDTAPPELAGFAESTLDSAEEHAAIIERFGRYPYRNEVLGRRCTAEEETWLAEGAKRFGQ